jgi:hypothetical protein
MAVPPVPPIAQAAAFTLGCALIHAFRRHPDRVTQILAVTAFTLFLALAFALTPADISGSESDAEAGVSIASAME